MPKFEIVPTIHAHILPVAFNLRECDLIELAASSGRSALTAINDGFARSVRCWTALVDDKPVAIFGVAPISILTGEAAPWLLATDGAHKVRKRFLIESMSYVKEMLSLYPVLRNAVHVDNKASIRWLNWLGFDILDALPIGVDGALFHPFEMRG